LSKLIHLTLISLCFQAASLECVEIIKLFSPRGFDEIWCKIGTLEKNDFVETGDNLFQQQLNNALSFDAIWIFTSNVFYN